jgi:hypothetical protein
MSEECFNCKSRDNTLGVCHVCQFKMCVGICIDNHDICESCFYDKCPVCRIEILSWNSLTCYSCQRTICNQCTNNTNYCNNCEGG